MAGLFGFLDRRSAPDVARSGYSASPGTVLPTLGSVPSSAGLLVSQATAMTISAVYAAVTIRARDVARCPPRLYSLGENNERIRVTDHPVARLFQRPNAAQTWFEFVRDFMIAHLLRGNAYAVIIRNRAGDPVKLIQINPDSALVLEGYDGQIFYQVSRLGLWQMAMLEGQPIAIPAEDVLHLRGPTFNSLVGASTIGLGRDSIGLAMGQSQQMSRWMGSGARPSGVLEAPKQLSEPAAKRLKESWQNFTGGIQNVGTTAVLEDGITWKPLQLTSVDLDFINQCNFTVQDIARFFNVPTRKLAQQDMTRGSTIIQEEQDYVNTVVAPDLDMIEQKFVQAFDLDAEGLGVDFDEGNLLRADALTRFNTYRLGVLTGILTPNEARTAECLPPIEGGDKLMVPANTAALGSEATGTAPDGAGRPAGGNAPAPAVPTNGTQPDAAPVDA